jgi:hypothetical protein
MEQSVTVTGSLKSKWLKIIGITIYIIFTIVAFMLSASIANNEMLEYVLGDVAGMSAIGIFVILDLIGGFLAAIPFGIGELIRQAEIQNGYLQIIAKTPDITKYTVEYTIDASMEEDTNEPPYIDINI